MVIAGEIAQPKPVRPINGGFTLVELLVVIAIIGVLVSLLVVALGVARSSVQESTLVTEVNSMSQALTSFKTQYGTDFPPDFSFSAQNNLKKQQIDRFLSRMFRYRNPVTDVPPGGAEFFENLDPAEALYFWLQGFTNDPQNPLFGSPIKNPNQPEERTPVMEFDKTRLLDKDEDGWLEYYPRFAQGRPYVYYVNYNYVINSDQSPQNLVYGLVVVPLPGKSIPTPIPAPRPYLSTLASDPPNPKIKAHYAAPDTFQILSAGMDNDFGVQVDNYNSLGFWYPLGPYPDKAHRDNITSFAEKTLEDALP